MNRQIPKGTISNFIWVLGSWLLVSGWLMELAAARFPGYWAMSVARVGVPIAGMALILSWLMKRLTADIRKKQESLRESLDLFELTLSTLEESVLILGPETGKIIRCNTTVERMFGYTQAELLGGNTRLLHVNQAAFAHFDKEMRVTTGGMGFVKSECEMKRKNGECFPAELFLRPNRKHGGPFFVVYVIRDLTERKKREEEFIRAQHLETIGVLAGGIAHDFNNLLTAIMGNINLAKIQLDPKDPVRELLADSETAAERAKDLTHQLLVFAKGGEPVRHSINLDQSIRQSVEFTLRGSNVKPVLRFAPDLWPVDADEGQLNQVVNNIIINAVQAMPDGGEIVIGIENFVLESSRSLPLQPGRYLKIAFQDQGGGIPPENLSKIFDPYFSTKPGGSGLGLATTYSIVLKHGGYIDVESRAGVGSLFSVYLPASERRSSRERGVAATPVTGTGRVLIVDDEAAVRKVAAELVRSFGYRVDCAENGENAVETYRAAAEEKDPFGVVLLDLTIPGEMGGKDIVRKLLEINEEAKVIVSSGYPGDPVMVDHRAHGFCGAVSKPYTGVELSQALARALTEAPGGQPAPVQA